MKTLAVLALVSIGAGRAAAPKGLVLEQDTSHSFRSLAGMLTQKDRQRVYLSKSGVRVESVTGDEKPKFYTIFRIDPKDRVVRVEVNGFRRTYREEDLAERAAENERLREALRKEAEEARKKADEETKERDGEGGDAEAGPASPLGLLAGELGPPGGEPEENDAPVEVKRTKDTRRIAGRLCRRFEFVQGGEKVFEAWYTEKDAPRWVRRFDLDESPGAGNAALMRARRERKGLELRSVLYLPAGGRAEVDTTKIIEKTIAPSTFKPPAGFKKAEPPAPATKGGPDT